MEPYVDENGIQFWYRNGKPNREDGPAIIYPSGLKFWYKDGLLHREDGPTIIYPSGLKYWYMNGKRHREDGPAFIYGVYKMWYENGVFIKSNAMDFDVDHYLLNHVPLIFANNVNYEVFNMNVDLFTYKKLPYNTIYRNCIINFEVDRNENFIECVFTTMTTP